MHATQPIQNTPVTPLSDRALGVILANTHADLANDASCRAALIEAGLDPQQIRGDWMAVKIEAHNYRACRAHMQMAMRQAGLLSLIFGLFCMFALTAVSGVEMRNGMFEARTIGTTVAVAGGLYAPVLAVVEVIRDLQG